MVKLTLVSTVLKNLRFCDIKVLNVSQETLNRLVLVCMLPWRTVDCEDIEVMQKGLLFIYIYTFLNYVLGFSCEVHNVHDEFAFERRTMWTLRKFYGPRIEIF